MSTGATGIAARADERRADQAGQAEAEDRQRKARADLVRGKAQHHAAANSAAIRAPASMPAATPSEGRVEGHGGGEAAGGAHRHHALEPRLRTPERSATSSPIAAISSGVEAVTMVRRMASKVVTCAPPRADEADAVAHQRVGGEHAEEQDALERLGEIERQLQQDLRALAADEGQRDDERRDQDADRVEPAEERDRDGREAVARRDRGLELADLPRHLGDARQAPRGRRKCAKTASVVVLELKPAKRAARGASP